MVITVLVQPGKLVRQTEPALLFKFNEVSWQEILANPAIISGKWPNTKYEVEK